MWVLCTPNKKTVLFVTLLENGEQSNTPLQHLYGEKKKAARRAVDKAKREMEEELYKQLDKDCGKKLIYKMA